MINQKISPPEIKSVAGQNAQGAQDGGDTWGEALAEYEKHANVTETV